MHSLESPPTGIYANAFSILEEKDQILLDFLVFSSSEQTAYLIMRLGVNTKMLKQFCDGLDRYNLERSKKIKEREE
jgi:hypothetical protein